MRGHLYIFTEMSEGMSRCPLTLNSQKSGAQVLAIEDGFKN